MEREKAFQTLGLSEGASDDEIRKAYKELAFQYHPDKIPNSCEKEKEEAKKRFQEINLAHELLTKKGVDIGHEKFTCDWFECKKLIVGRKVCLSIPNDLKDPKKGKILLNNKFFCSRGCALKYYKANWGENQKSCRNCGNLHRNEVPIKCEKIISAISELELLNHWFYFKTDEKEEFIQKIKYAKTFSEEKEFDSYIKKILKQAEEFNKNKKDLLASERSKHIRNLENLDLWKLLNKKAQDSFREEVKGCSEANQFNNILERIKKIINKQLDNLITRGQQANSYEKLEPIIKEIKKYSFTISYLKKKEKIKSLEERFALLDPQKFDEKLFQEQLRNNEISWNDLDQETKKEIEDIKKNNTSEKGKKLKEKINEKGAEIRLRKLIICARKTTTEDEKKEMIKKLIEFINKTTYQNKAYHKFESEIEIIINELNGKSQFGRPSEPFPYRKLLLLLVPFVIILISIFLIRNKKKRKIR